MNIKNRLALYFTIIYGIVIFVVLAFSYYTDVEFSRKYLYSQLQERTFITAQVYLEEDELTRSQWLPYKNELSDKLPDEIIQMYDSLNQNAFIEKTNKFRIPIATLDKIRDEKELKFSIGNRQFYGIYYKDNQGNFVIVASALDKAEMAELNNLLTMMLTGYIVSIIFIYFAGQYFAKKSLEPIINIISQVRKITSTNLKVRVQKDKNKDEIFELATTFNDMLERIDKAFEIQKTFVSNASHELRTPLTGIITELELILNKDREKQEYRESLTNVLKDSQLLKDLVNNLLNIAQTEVTDQNINIEEIRLDELLLEIKRDILIKKPAARINIDFIDLPDDTILLTIPGNRQLMVAAISNLIDNAIKFSDNKEVSCIITYRKKEIILKIIDKGIGINENDVKHIFQPFYRAANASSYGGHGIGLSLSEKIIKMHKGKILIHSKINVGTTIELVF